MSPELLEPDLREWDLGAVPTEVLVSALGRPAEESARECARASCVIAIAESVAPPEYPDRTMIHEYMRERMNARIDVRIDVRTEGWWADVATLLVLGVPVSVNVGPVPRKRHGWPREYRTSLRAQAKDVVRGWGDAGVMVRESADEPGQWPSLIVPTEAWTAERTLVRTDGGFDLVWHMPGLPRGIDRVRLGRWREFAVWQIGTSVSAVRLPPVLARCAPVGVEFSPDRWVTRWSPDASVWPDV